MFLGCAKQPHPRNKNLKANRARRMAFKKMQGLDTQAVPQQWAYNWGVVMEINPPETGGGGDERNHTKGRSLCTWCMGRGGLTKSRQTGGNRRPEEGKAKGRELKEEKGTKGKKGRKDT